MPIGISSTTLVPAQHECVTAFPNLVAHPFDDIRKHDYRSTAEGWYMHGNEYLKRWGRGYGHKSAARQFIATNLVRAGITTDTFSISTSMTCPETNMPTVFVYKIDKHLPNGFGN